MAGWPRSIQSRRQTRRRRSGAGIRQQRHCRQEYHDRKAAALLDYLDRQVRYTGIEFGGAAIIPHDPAETLAKKYGDCKDKATLLVTMFRAAGVPAYVALLNAGSRMDVPAELPGMGLFDHAIVYVPEIAPASPNLPPRRYGSTPPTATPASASFPSPTRAACPSSLAPKQRPSRRFRFRVA